MTEGTETGLKWWMRYVIVPLIGGGTIVTLVVALINRPNNSSSSVDKGVSSIQNEPKKPRPKDVTSPEPVDQPLTHVELRAYSQDVKVNGRPELLAPGGTRAAHRGETVMFEWGIAPHQGQLGFVVRPNQGGKSGHAVDDKGQFTMRVNETATYSLETDYKMVARIELQVE